MEVEGIDPKVKAHIDNLIKVHGSAESVLSSIMGVASDVVYQAERLLDAKSLREQHTALVSLGNDSFDLKTWLPGFDAYTGTMPWDRD